MRDLTKVILQMNSEIDAELGRFTRENRAEVSKKVMEPLRHFVEALSLFILIKVKNEPLNYNYERINEALRYIKNNTDTIFIYKFHQQLQAYLTCSTFNLLNFLIAPNLFHQAKILLLPS